MPVSLKPAGYAAFIDHAYGRSGLIPSWNGLPGVVTSAATGIVSLVNAARHVPQIGVPTSSWIDKATPKVPPNSVVGSWTLKFCGWLVLRLPVARLFSFARR